MKTILYIFGKDRSVYLNKNEGEYPDNILYGFNYIKKYSDFQCDYLNKKNLFVDFIDQIISRIFFSRLKISFNLFYIFVNIKKINSYETIFCINDSVALPALFFKKIGLIRSRIIYVSIGLADKLRAKFLVLRFIKSIVIMAKKVIVFSESEKKQFDNFLHKKITDHIIFGIDTSFFKPTDSIQGDFFLSLGSDPERDYSTLCLSWKNNENLVLKNNVKLTILVDRREITSLKNLISANKICNLEIDDVNRYSLAKIKKMFSEMIAGVVPVKNVSRSSGQTAALSMLAMNKSVIASSNAWQEDYQFNHRELVTVEPENVKELADGISNFIKKKYVAEINSFEEINKKYNSYIMFKNIYKISDFLIK